MASTPSLASNGQPLRSALKAEDDNDKAPLASSSASVKAVQIAEPEQFEEDDPEELVPKRQFSAGKGKRLSGRPPVSGDNSSRASLSQSNLEAFNGGASVQSGPEGSLDGAPSHSHHRHRLDHVGHRMVAQVAEWLEHEKNKASQRKTKWHHSSKRKTNLEKDESQDQAQGGKQRTYSMDSQSSDVSLDRLQRILDDSMGALGISQVPQYSPRLSRRSQRKRSIHLTRAMSSDTEWADGDILVPSCAAVLDNSKTMSYSGGLAGSTEDVAAVSSRKEKERKSWLSFKNEIIRLAHTLRLKGWRRVALDSGETIGVERLSGALTNAVYVVTPPNDLPDDGKKAPSKLLLRVYGPQVEHIIDRENELSVLRRLARKKIGPRLLGTFKNGRFEQYLNAITLTAANLREPDTSKQIAKRMRELHDGVELLEEERDAGPAIWKNWDHWLDRVEKAIMFLDQKILSGTAGPVRGPNDAWKTRGPVCGTEWAKFHETVNKLREHISNAYGDAKTIRQQLVFAHNDTQYGNILRVRPDDDKSPLLQPNYEHRQLVVIDFEYAAANMRGYEFANHFTEWSYNYHDTKAPHACKPYLYPKPEEQRRFIKSYVEHQPEFPHASSTPNLAPTAVPAGGSGTPGQTPTPGSSSVVEFMLDARAPPGGWREEERRREEKIEHQVNELMAETRLWRAANSVFWVAWGIMQGKIPGFDTNESLEGDDNPKSPGATSSDEEHEEEEEEFDYLGYSYERALFFWGDCVQMGLVKLEELPEGYREKVKILDY